MGIYYGEQSAKCFKAKLKVSEEELEKYLESWDDEEDLLQVSLFKLCGSENDYAIWCLKSWLTVTRLPRNILSANATSRITRCD